MRKTTCSALLCVALSLPACGARQPHPFELDEAQAGAPGVETVGLLPLNVLMALPPALDAGARGVKQEIHDHLEACGREVRPFGIREARSLWSEVAGPAAGADADGGLSEAQLAEFVRRLHALRPFDVLVAPNLVLRQGSIRYSSQEVAWDGVTRKIEVVGYHHMSGDLAVTSKMRGEFTAVSLLLLAFDPEGKRIFKSYGGLDLIHEVKFATEFRYDANMHSYPVPVADVRMKRRRLKDEARLREGVVIAFHPFLVSPTRPVGQAP